MQHGEPAARLGRGGLHQQPCGNLILEDRLVLYHTIERGRNTLINSLNEAWMVAIGCCACSQCATCSCSCHNCCNCVVCCTVVVIDVTLKHMLHVVGGYCVSQPRCHVLQLHLIETTGICLVDERLQGRVSFDCRLLPSVEFPHGKDV
jgi:hypothetical protein